MRLSEIESATHLMIELIRMNWRKSPNQHPVPNDPKSPYFRAIYIEKTAGQTFDPDYFRRIDIYPQGDVAHDQVGLTALISSEDKIVRWEVFQHYSGCSPLTSSTTEIELSRESIEEFLVRWLKK